MALRCTKPFLRLRTCCLGTTHCKRSVASARTLPAVDASFGRSVQLPAQHDKGTDKHDRFTCHASLSSLLDGSDVVGDYTQQLTEEIHDLATEVREFVPEKADEILSSDDQDKIKGYINRFTDLLLLEVDAEVQEFVSCLKDWPLKWLQDDGRVLLGLSAMPAGEYYQQEAVRFYLPPASGSSSKGEKSYSYSSSDTDEEWSDLPRHSLAPGDMVLVTPGKKGPLTLCNNSGEPGWRSDMLIGVVIERTRTSIKVAFDTAPEKDELDSETWRLDKSVNTLTTQRALLAMVALWHRMPLQSEASFNKAIKKLCIPFGSDTPQPTFKGDINKFYTLSSAGSNRPRQHSGIFEGSALSGVILTADKDFDWDSLPANAGGMTQAALRHLQPILPAAGRPNEAATSALSKRMERDGQLNTGSKHGPLLLDASQMQAIATAVMHPLALLHGPPGTGKTTTIGWLFFFLRKQYGYKGRILATAQSNVAVDNMLETALFQGRLRVLRIGEPAKVRSCLQSFTLKAQLATAVAQDAGIMKARSEQQSLRRRLRNSRRRRGGEYLERWERREIYERLDELNEEIKAATDAICRELLDAADVVGVTCTGAAGPELQHFAFDMVVIDEGSQASEPEALIPIMKGSQRVVLVGDHKQLPPVIKSRDAESGGLAKSLFERLMQLGAPSAMLQVQYRSHPLLMEFINEQYYNSLLSNGVSAAARPAPHFPFPNPSVPLVFIHVEGKESSSARGSKMNEREADVLEGCVRYLVERCSMQPGQLGVITPYAAQVALLSKRLQKQGYNINGSGSSSWDSQGDLEVKTVDGYQGREKDIILLSTVRANSNQEVGFLEDWRRANVALSRARTALVVVGHKSTLRSSKTWSAFLKHAEQRDCLVQVQQLKSVLSTAVSSHGRRR